MSERKKVSIGKAKAIELANSGWWEDKTAEEIVDVQLFTNELCCPFSVFHESLEKCLRRPVWTHELGLNYDGLIEEYLGQRKAPTFLEIVDLIPEEKLIIVNTPRQ